MPDASSFSSRSRFITDLRRIREDRGLPLEALHEETKIPLGVLEEFEETGLFDNPMFNRVYLRSLVRTYAAFVGVPTSVMLEALDEALLDAYQGSLARQFLGEGVKEAPKVSTPEPPKDEVPADEAPTEEPSVATSPSEDAPAYDPAVAASAMTPEEEAPAYDPADAAPAVTPEEQPPREEAPAQEKALPKRTPVPHRTAAGATSWEAQSPAPVGRREPLDIKSRASYMQWLLIGGAVVGLVAIIWGVFALLDRPDDDPTRRPQPVAVDTAAVDTVATAPERPEIVVGDTLNVVLLATDRVQGIRITRDDDLRRPYWIETGVAKAFPALEQIIIENFSLEDFRLIVEGYEYPKDRQDDQGRIVLTREAIEAFVDTLTVSAVQLPTTPELVPINY